MPVDAAPTYASQRQEAPMLTYELIAALLTAVDSKLAVTDILTLEDLELTQRLLQAKIELETISARQA
jgi:hypothetical protein